MRALSTNISPKQRSHYRVRVSAFSTQRIKISHPSNQQSPITYAYANIHSIDDWHETRSTRSGTRTHFTTSQIMLKPPALEWLHTISTTVVPAHTSAGSASQERFSAPSNTRLTFMMSCIYIRITSRRTDDDRVPELARTTTL